MKVLENTLMPNTGKNFNSQA